MKFEYHLKYLGVGLWSNIRRCRDCRKNMYISDAPELALGRCKDCGGWEVCELTLKLSE